MSPRLFIAALVALCSLLLGACGQPFCAHLESTNHALVEKAKSCPNIQVKAGPSEATCETSRPKCTAADLDVLERQLNCLGRVGTCVAGQELSWQGQLAACEPANGQVSSACRDALQ